MDPLEIGRVSTSLPNAASLSWPASDEMLDHDDADGGTRATRTSTAATHNGKKRKLQAVQAEDGGEENGPRRMARARKPTAAKQNEGTAGPSKSGKNVRWSPAEDARLRAAVFACSGIGPATNSSVPINLGTSEWPVVKRVFDSLALTEFAATATPRSVAALRAHFDSVLSPKINKPLTSPRRLDLDQARPFSTASTEAEVAATAASIQRPLSQVAAGVGGSPEADVGRSSGRLDGSKATSETTDAQEPGIVGSAAASNGISADASGSTSTTLVAGGAQPADSTPRVTGAYSATEDARIIELLKSGMPQTYAAKALNRSSTSVHQRVGILRDRGLISRPLPAPSLVAALQNAQQTLTSASQSPFERFSSVAVPSTQAAVDHLQAGASSAAATAPQPKFQDLEAAKHRDSSSTTQPKAAVVGGPAFSSPPPTVSTPVQSAGMIAAPPPYTAHDDAIMLGMYLQGNSAEQIGTVLNRSTYSVQRR
ncbi:hypothetical protein JCM8115_002636 [Rhodotorula mucilaginosa]